MIDDDEKVTVTDSPQMVSVSHRNAGMFNYSPPVVNEDDDGRPMLEDVLTTRSHWTRTSKPVDSQGKTRRFLKSLRNKAASRRMMKNSDSGRNDEEATSLDEEAASEAFNAAAASHLERLRVGSSDTAPEFDMATAERGQETVVGATEDVGEGSEDSEEDGDSPSTQDVDQQRRMKQHRQRGIAAIHAGSKK